MKTTIIENNTMRASEQLKPGYKKTFIGMIPEDWEVKKFEDFADKKVKWSITGGPFGSDLKVSDYVEKGVRIIQLQNIGDGVFNDKNKIYTTEKKADKLRSCNIYPGEIILSKMGDPVARACFIPKTESRFVMASDGIRLVVDEDKFDKKYVHDFINYQIFRKKAISVSTGTTRQRIGLPALKKINVISPPLPEQKAIADCLSTWDKGIEKLSALIASKKEQKKGLMQQLLTGNKRLDGFKEEWRKIKLGDVTNVKSSKRVLKKDWLDYGVPFYRTREVIRLANKQGFRTPIFISEKLYLELSEKYGVPNTGDLLVTGVGTIGETYVVEEEDRFYFKDGNVLWIQITDKVNSYFLHYSFKARYIRKQLIDNASITTVATFTIEGAKGTNILLPPIKEQIAISEVLITADKEIEILEKKLETFKTQKKGLMQVLLTGEKRLN